MRPLTLRYSRPSSRDHPRIRGLPWARVLLDTRDMLHTRASSRVLVPVLLGLGFAAAACSNSALSVPTGDASAGKTGAAGSGAAGQTGAAGSATGTAGTGASGSGGAGGTGGSTGAAGTGGAACGSSKCVAGGKCCFACISLCAGPGEQCPVFIQDPCATQRDAGADAPAGPA